MTRLDDKDGLSLPGHFSNTSRVCCRVDRSRLVFHLRRTVNADATWVWLLADAPQGRAQPSRVFSMRGGESFSRTIPLCLRPVQTLVS